MSSQHAVDEIRTPSPTSDDVDLPASGRKRKYDEVGDDAQYGPVFTIKHLDSSETTVVRPRLLLPRRCLPLAYLDTNATESLPQRSKVFTASIPALEMIAVNDQEHNEPFLLIAQCDGRSMYAIERLSRGVYAQCKLSSWVTIDHLDDLRLKGQRAPPSPMRRCLHEIETWWKPLIACEVNRKRSPPPKEESSLPGRKTLLDLRKPSYHSQTKEAPVREATIAEPGKSVSTTNANFGEESRQDGPQSPIDQTVYSMDDPLKSIRVHYVDSLYRSKASLAYFAKGPLSRARAAFSENDRMSTHPRQLVDYLRECMLPLNLLDKKYRETLPNLVSEVPDAHISEDERVQTLTKFQKGVRKLKKENIRKNGLFPQEEMDIIRWWLDHPLPDSACDAVGLRAEASKSKILEQRTRETQLQIILMLEALALERSMPMLPVSTTTEETQGDEMANRQGKSKRPLDLNLLLDLSVDRLCIWQSMTAEDDDSSKKPEDLKSTAREGLHRSKQDTNHLRDFCVDVLMPFYTARLPDLSRTLCKKLGGPVPHSSARPTLKKMASASIKPPKPGAAVERLPAQEARRTLERVLTEDRTSRRPTPTLTRSATESVIPKLKREPSETSLNMVPLNRSGFYVSQRFDQREVDLAANSQATEAKIRKKANVEQELKGAIAALKKPNPRMAVKEYVEAGERRAGVTKSTGSRNQAAKALAQSVQIMATPAANRRRDVYSNQPSELHNAALAQQEPEEIPPSSCSHVPASSVKQTEETITDSHLRPKRRLMPTIEQTPTRGPLKYTNPSDGVPRRLNLAGGTGQRTPSTSKNSVVPASVLAAERKATDQLSLGPSGVQATPSRKPSINLRPIQPTVGVKSTPTKPLRSVSGNLTAAKSSVMDSPASNGRSTSIYKDLGWDDDVDELM